MKVLLFGICVEHKGFEDLKKCRMQFI
uniref:Uncharacterized protein n=1 Tax=Rhizophora mucronata TaxID=61149 RepID=A0A2P2PQU0_RHIMU